ncbi:MAG: hypothetical protein ACLP1Y_01445 [Candidatus Acidiferrales bacterium]
MTTRELYRHPKVRLGFWIGLVLLAAVPLYYVREMLALLVLFAVFFAVVTTVALALYLVNYIGQAGLTKGEPYVRSVARASRRGLGFVGEFSKKPFRRQHSETAP